MQKLIWHDTIGGGAFAEAYGGAVRSLRREGSGFVCEWLTSGQEPEDWTLDSALDLAAAKRVVESWETPEGWEDDE